MRVAIAVAALICIAGCANGGGQPISPSPVVVTPTVPSSCAVPGVPDHLSAEVDGASVSLSWSTVGDATDYVLLVGWTRESSETVLTNTSEAHHWIELIPAGTHFARVHAHNWCGTSDSSEPIAFTVR